MDKQKEIEEMAQCLCPRKHLCVECDFEGECGYKETATRLINAGYGNVNQAVKEFAEKLKEKKTWWDTELCGDEDWNYCVMVRDIDELLKEYNYVDQT